MPKSPKGQKRPADVIRNAVLAMKIATGQIDESVVIAPKEKDAAAVALGRKGGAARAKKLGTKRRKAIARQAASVRWGKK